jgi:hypothetical protein
LDLLTKTVENFKIKHLNSKFNYNKMSLRYWINKIKNQNN